MQYINMDMHKTCAYPETSLHFGVKHVNAVIVVIEDHASVVHIDIMY